MYQETHFSTTTRSVCLCFTLGSIILLFTLFAFSIIGVLLLKGVSTVTVIFTLEIVTRENSAALSLHSNEVLGSNLNQTLIFQ